MKALGFGAPKLAFAGLSGFRVLECSDVRGSECQDIGFRNQGFRV